MVGTLISPLKKSHRITPYSKSTQCHPPVTLKQFATCFRGRFAFVAFLSRFDTLSRAFSPVGGDTLWANAYDAYDRLSPTFRAFLEGLTATNRGDPFVEASKMTGQPLAKNRGAPDNSSPVGDDLTAVHPVIRTNPVTGWKALYVNPTYGGHTKYELIDVGLQGGLTSCQRTNPT
jgi:alpha-ketoglutarate-dependent taurine dioxygenase